MKSQDREVLEAEGFLSSREQEYELRIPSLCLVSGEEKSEKGTACPGDGTAL